MPNIIDSVEKGPLSAPERAVLDAVRTHSPPFVWSTSLEDLFELAKWATYPTSRSIPATMEEYARKREGNNQSDEIPMQLDINTKVAVYMGEGRDPKTTYSLRTIMSALSNLHHTGMIWAYKMHKRTHYGAFFAEHQVREALERLSPEGQKKANFTPLEAKESAILDIGTD